MSERPLRYTLDEVHSYLPTGWNLSAPDSRGRWDPRKRRWSTEVHDGADQVWRVEVKASDAAKLGRLPALQRAMNRVYRTGVGKDGFFG